MARDGSAEYSSPLKLPSPLNSTAKVLIACYCHDKRLRFSCSVVRLFSAISVVIVFFVVFSQNGRLFVFLRNTGPSIEVLKFKFSEYLDPPSQHFFVAKAFSSSFLCRRKVALCQSGRMAHSSQPQ